MNWHIYQCRKVDDRQNWMIRIYHDGRQPSRIYRYACDSGTPRFRAARQRSSCSNRRYGRRTCEHQDVGLPAHQEWTSHISSWNTCCVPDCWHARNKDRHHNPRKMMRIGEIRCSHEQPREWLAQMRDRVERFLQCRANLFHLPCMILIFFVVTLPPLGYLGIISYFMFGDVKVQKTYQIS